MIDEKKKLAVVGALVVLIGGIGAFQFVKGHKPPAPVSDKKVVESVIVAEKPDAPKNPQVANDLPPRDPFQVPADQAPPDTAAKPKSQPEVAQGPGHAPRSEGVQPLPIAGAFGPGAIGSPQISKIPSTPFGYRMVGAISGQHPAVLLEDSTGNQKLVPVGSAVDGDTRLESLEGDSAYVVFRGKRLRMSMGGNPFGK